MVHETVFIFAISRQMVIGQVVHSFAFFTTLSLYSNLPGLPPRVTLPEKTNSRVGILAITLSSDNRRKVVASI